MRVLLLGGYAESLVNFRGALIDDLIEAGNEVHVAAPALLDDEVLVREICSRGAVPHSIVLHRRGMNPLADVRTVYELWRLMRKLRPHAMLAYTIKPVVYGTLVARWVGVPMRFALITGLGYAFEATGQDWKQRCVSVLAQRLYRWALSGVRKVFFQNPDDERLFRCLGILHSQVPSVVVNGSGVDTSYFGRAPMPDGPPVFLLIARLLGAKGLREYAASARRVRQARPQVRFQLVGWYEAGPDSITPEELDAWVSAGDIEFLGRLDDVRAVLQACSVYVLPSYREGMPRTVLEAMAVGRPVITTDVPGCRETVEPGVNGYLVPVRSADGLVRAITTMLDNPGKLAAMGAASRRMAEDRYDVHCVNRIMLTEMGLAR